MNALEKQQFLSHWEKQRGKGVLTYVTTVAVVWGTLGAVFTRLVLHLFDQGFSMAALQDALVSPDFVRWLGFFLLGGLALGVLLWFYFEWVYRRYKKAAEQEQQ